eukprot:CAMPEP_0194241630 /NCGR_PEP_ID=MMETSP0158-20130606/7435_1 /TAXON_ID=33649 /ORGANISM="Thalassionema nitzschioides, Strain L26-B" /LENGTH=549 /DNA_ID=CAMNT_0038976563 /DNA_START=296 /DNA_END=1941 /DNA_ORIENTATION=+
MNTQNKEAIIIVVGSANVDLNSYCPTLPTKGETILGTEFKISLGGKGANQAIAAARIADSSMQQIHMICKLGNDDHGQKLTKSFDENRVQYQSETVVSQKAESHTGIASITVDSAGENTIVVVPGSNYDLTSDDVKNQVEEIINNTNTDTNAIVMTQLEIPQDVALTAMKIGRKAGALTILNPAPAPEELDPEFYDYTDIIIPNETELRKLVPNNSGKSNEELAKELLLQRGVRKAVIITLGEKGAMVVEKQKDGTVKVSLVQAPQEVQNNNVVVDTVGAGDCFCGSLAVYLSSRSSSSYSIDTATIKACGVAGLSVRKRGAQSSYPSRLDLPECLLPVGGDSSDEPKTTTTDTITFVTGNKKKLEEVQRLLRTPTADDDSSLASFTITNQKLDLPELQGNDPVEIAIEKCKLAAKETAGPVFIEDTSLCFNALNGMPGVYIKWFLERCGHDGLNKMLDGFDDRSAYAQTIIAFTARVGEKVHVFDGRTNGNIVAARGPLDDSGWDPIFEPLKYPLGKQGNKKKTYAEMYKDEKDIICHRGRAFAKFET